MKAENDNLPEVKKSSSLGLYIKPASELPLSESC